MMTMSPVSSPVREHEPSSDAVKVQDRKAMLRCQFLKANFPHAPVDFYLALLLVHLRPCGYQRNPQARAKLLKYPFEFVAGIRGESLRDLEGASPGHLKSC